MDRIVSVAELETCIGVAGLGVKMKIIDHLDETAAGWIAASPIAFIGVATEDGPTVTAAGGPAGFAIVAGKTTLRIPLSAIDEASALVPGAGAGVLFLATGVGETLRANGRVARVDDQAVELSIEECFVHCAKALIRSAFWAGDAEDAPSEPGAFLDASRFLALATMDGRGLIDVSPKGDPAGLLLRSDGGRVTLAERPGNRLAFGYHNIIERHDVAALALIPGSTQVALLQGRAALTTDEAIRNGFVVEGKKPILATVIDTTSVALKASPALARAGLWSGLDPARHIDPAATLVAHLKLNREEGVQATMLRLAATRDVVAGGLKSSYKTDLY
ncbi:pyridoxamine 5-phosphate oxidase [Caulobacter sp. SLTY]|uniref:pyridoxamine 5'-phosphate oxidase family protein n=1 Tax=Caulobacter sp. SLTY TaxID=2683262 RepID=UPI0014122000|nr:pyridoxamine 5-phosphate oxidase [Caulobacter sp. SLTY]NBB15620.1 pyridoxamine 5-phosphate oxidase [Caulobacter sp. SLTY]